MGAYMRVRHPDLANADSWLSAEKRLTERLQESCQASVATATARFDNLAANCRSEEEQKGVELMRAAFFKEVAARSNGTSNVNSMMMPVKTDFNPSDLRPGEDG